MRPAGKGPLESLYFDYPKFEAKLVPELDGRDLRHPVFIVGAGPIGMTAALTLARYGIRSVVLERKTTFNDGSRAICVSRASFNILQQIGAVAPFLEKALGWRRGRSFYRGREIYSFEMPHSDNEKYLPMYNLQQQYIEQYLWSAVARNELIDMRWDSEVTGIEQRDGNVRIKVASPLGNYMIDTDYVLAADGARSAVRSVLGLRLKGENYEGRYVIADVKMKSDYPTERRALFEPQSNPGGTVLIHKQPDDIWRIDYQLRDGESAEEAVEENNIRTRVQAILHDIGHNGPWELEWWSVYTANTLCLDDYRNGRVFFIGDSAHIVPIFGVRGLNNGLADAFNIGWKLGYVLNGVADVRLLDSYSLERRGATLDVFANAGKSARFMTPPTRGSALVREAVLSLSLSQEFTRPFADPRQMVPYKYSEGHGDSVMRRDREFASGPDIGSASPNVQLADGSHLLDRVGTGFCVLLFADGGYDNFKRLEDALAALDPNSTLLIVGVHDAQGERIISDPAGEIARLFTAPPGAAYLLRPDLHIAGRWTSFLPNELVAALRANLGGSYDDNAFADAVRTA